MTELTIECPVCGEERELLPHPAHDGRLVAYCDCRGPKVAVIDVSASAVAEYEEPDVPYFLPEEIEEDAEEGESL